MTRPDLPREQLLAGVEFLLPHRSAYDIAAALGYKRPGSVARAAYRAGRTDLAAPFTQADNALRLGGVR